MNSTESWKELAANPSAAARELLRRVGTRLNPDQRRAAIAWLPDAAALEQGFAAAPPGSPLRGVPYVLKDNLDLAGAPTFAGSTFLPEIRGTPGSDSRIVRDLRAAGAVCAGKAQLHEFACGNTGENPHYGDCEHPAHPGHLAGGSSSGSAVAVAAGIVPFAIGTDTGGSIRGPAAFCGLYGMRLSPGDAWIAGAIPVAPSFDTIGWLAGSAADLLAVNRALVGTAAMERTPRGVYVDFGSIDVDVSAACGAAAREFCDPADAATRSGLASAFQGGADTYTALTGVEVAHVHREWLDRYRDRYSPPVWTRIEQGRHVTPDALLGARFRQSALRTTLASYFTTFDFLALPAVPCPALTKEQCTPVNRRRMLELCAPATLAGLPVLSIPVPLPSGLSAGLQIVVTSPLSPVIGRILGQR